MQDLVVLESQASQQKVEYQRSLAARALAEKKICTIDDLATVDTAIRQMQANQHAAMVNAEAIEKRVGKAGPGVRSLLHNQPQAFTHHLRSFEVMSMCEGIDLDKQSPFNTHGDDLGAAADLWPSCLGTRAAPAMLRPLRRRQR
ncbi:MAG TPA: hypothetical protein VG326_00300 [Tepidisphaeraceae bacterium]|nr:hypothetical protein [Tepidisphaeraceae bacterium]